MFLGYWTVYMTLLEHSVIDKCEIALPTYCILLFDANKFLIIRLHFVSVVFAFFLIKIMQKHILLSVLLYTVFHVILIANNTS